MNTQQLEDFNHHVDQVTEVFMCGTLDMLDLDALIMKAQEDGDTYKLAVLNMAKHQVIEAHS